MERQVSVGPDRPVKEDHLWRWTTFFGKFPRGPKRPIYVSTEIPGNFGIMESTLVIFFYRKRATISQEAKRQEIANRHEQVKNIKLPQNFHVRW